MFRNSVIFGLFVAHLFSHGALEAYGQPGGSEMRRPQTSQYREPAGPYVDPSWYLRQPSHELRRRLRSPSLDSIQPRLTATASPAPIPPQDPNFKAPNPLLGARRVPAIVQPAFARELPRGERRTIGDFIGPQDRSRLRFSRSRETNPESVSPLPESNFPSLEPARPAATTPSNPSVSRSAVNPVRRVDAPRSNAGRSYRPLAPRRVSRPGAKLRPLQLPPAEIVRRERLLRPGVPIRRHPSSSRPSGSEGAAEDDNDTASEENGVTRAAAAVLDEPDLLPVPERRLLPRPTANRITPLQNKPSTTKSPEAVNEKKTHEANAADSPAAGNETATSNAPARLTQEWPENLAPLRSQVRATLGVYFNRRENASTRSPWGMLHALLPFGVDSELIAGGRRVNSLGWLCWNGRCWGQQLLFTENGQLRVRQGPGVQGHPGQFLAILAQCKVKKDFGLRVEGHDFTVEDLVKYEMQTCVSKSELTFKLIGLSHYLKSDAVWTSSDGEQWSISRLIDEELGQEVNGAACGGTHRIMGYAYCVNRRRKRDEPIEGAWLRAQQAVDSYLEHIATLRNPDGSYSTEWLEGRGAEDDIDRRMKTTGHVVEWLVFTLPREELLKPEFIETIEYLNDLMMSNRDYEWSVGPKGHALRALALYDERVFDGKPGRRKTQLAEALRRLR